MHLTMKKVSERKISAKSSYQRNQNLGVILSYFELQCNQLVDTKTSKRLMGI